MGIGQCTTLFGATEGKSSMPIEADQLGKVLLLICKRLKDTCQARS